MRCTIFSSGTSMSMTLSNHNAHAVQSLGLGDCAGEAVQNKAVFTVILGQTLLDDANHNFVRYQLACVHKDFARSPISVPLFSASRIILPVEAAGIFKCSQITSAWFLFRRLGPLEE